MEYAKYIMIGRGIESDVRITDISVSRQHAQIKIDSKGYYYIQDQGAKFGTLAMVKAPILIDEYSG